MVRAIAGVVELAQWLPYPGIMAGTDTPDSAASSRDKPNVTVSQADTKLLLALRTHLHQLIRTAVRPEDRCFRRVIDMDHGELLLASASLRALFFDHSPRPLLTGWFEAHRIAVQIETIETNIGLVLLSQLLPEAGHVSDFLTDCLLDPDRAAYFPIDQTTQNVIFFEDWKGLEGLRARPEPWVPSREDAEKTNSSLTHMSNVGPSQLLDVTRRLVDLAGWGDIRIGYLKGIAITRKRIIDYVANHLGGVHYDSNRTPRDPRDAAEFRVLASAMDWNDEAITHAGFIAVGLACIEILNSPGMIDLYNQCSRILQQRQHDIVARGEKAMQGRAAGEA